ncbi:MAG: hypothetical protein LBC78_02000 [Oscillospiraceae bacterium]|nr:hypothetical protein [Oscillospiraceae bacterium]
MNPVLLGYMFAAVSSVFSALYVLPKKLSKQKPVTYAMLTGGGYFVISGAGFALLKAFDYIDEPLFFPQLAIACADGVVWTIASVSALTAIDRIGLAKSNQWKSLQGPIGSFLMLLFLSEFLTAKAVFIVAAIILITLAAMMFSTREHDGAPMDKSGIAYALAAALFYGISGALTKYLIKLGRSFRPANMAGAVCFYISGGLYVSQIRNAQARRAEYKKRNRPARDRRNTVFRQREL